MAQWLERLAVETKVDILLYSEKLNEALKVKNLCRTREIPSSNLGGGIFNLDLLGISLKERGYSIFNEEEVSQI